MFRENRKRMKRDLPKNIKSLIVEAIHSVIKRKSKSFVKPIIHNKFEKENSKENDR